MVLIYGLNTIQGIELYPGTNISTCRLAPASELLKKGLSDKCIILCTCPNVQADFLKTTHGYIENGIITQKYAGLDAKGEPMAPGQ